MILFKIAFALDLLNNCSNPNIYDWWLLLQILVIIIPILYSSLVKYHLGRIPSLFSNGFNNNIYSCCVVVNVGLSSSLF